MKRRHSLAGVVFSALLIGVMALPTLRWLMLRGPDGALYGYSASVPAPPANLLQAFRDKSLQAWAEKFFDVNLGFREALVRSFNEVNFRIFHEAPKINLHWTSAHGLYSRLSIDSLNDELLHRDTLQPQFDTQAAKLLELQQTLQAAGKHFEVVIATSKPYVYPHGLARRLLVDDSPGMFQRAASFGQALREAGVNVTDSGPMLRQLADAGLQTHPDSGVHWNYYAGCLIAARLMDNARNASRPTPVIDCGQPDPQPAHWIDVDGLLLMNLWTNGGFNQPSLYPRIRPVAADAWRPRIVFIGDSFSDQIRAAWKMADAYSNLVMSSYFRLREVDAPVRAHRDGIGKDLPAESLSSDDKIRAALMRDIAQSDVVILQMVDYNVKRFGYGLADYVLGQRQQVSSTN